MASETSFKINNVAVAKSAQACTGNAATATTAENCTGNSATATKLATARTIAIGTGATGTATSFDGSGDITIPVTSIDGTKVTGKVPSATSADSATTAGSCTGNAATATKLSTARNISIGTGATGTATAFDGSEDITIPVTSLDATRLEGTAAINTMYRKCRYCYEVSNSKNHNVERHGKRKHYI